MDRLIEVTLTLLVLSIVYVASTLPSQAETKSALIKIMAPSESRSVASTH